MKFLKQIRAAQVNFFQKYADQAQPNDRALTLLVAKLLGVNVSPRPMQYDL